VNGLIQDLRYAARSLLKSPGFTVVAVLTLALGIGATTTIFSLVEGVLLRSLPFPDAGRLVLVTQIQDKYRGPGRLGSNGPLSAFDRWRTAVGAFDGTAVYAPQSVVLRERGPAEHVTAYAVDAAFFPLLGARPAAGRTFDAPDDTPGAAPVALVSHDFWTTRLAADPRAVGGSLTLDTTVYTVVGVMPAGFRYPAKAQVWTNLGAYLAGPAGTERAKLYMFWELGRLRAGVTPATAQARLDVVWRRAWTADADARGWLPVVTPLRDYLTGGVRPRLLLLFGAVGLVLLIACANVAGLVLARSLGRRHQIAIRAALGAGRAGLIRGSLVESSILAIVGGALGLLGAAWAVPLLVKLAGAELPGLLRVSLDGRVVCACLAMSLGAGLLAGSVPAAHAARLPPAEVLQASGHGRATARGRLGSALIVAQLALTSVLLAGSALLARSFQRLTTLDPGYDPRHLIVADVQLPAVPYGTGARRLAYLRQALQAVSAVPGVATVAAGSGIPLEGGGFSVETREAPDGRIETRMYWVAAVSSAYFRVLGIPLVRGRTLADEDPGAVVLDAAAARAFFPGQDPVGKPFPLWGQSGAVVGVVGDVRQQSLLEPPQPHVYQALGPSAPGYLRILARTDGDPERSVDPVRRRIEEVDPGVPVDRVAPMTAMLADSLARQRLYALLLGAFSAMALLLSALGMYGLVSHTVAGRRREFGVRIALGAGRGGVLRLVVGRVALLALLGAGLGLAAARMLTYSLRSLLFETGPSDPVALTLSGALLIFVALAASWLPARRATKVDPVEALRSE
jgi:putative ABC transport system permease protein